MDLSFVWEASTESRVVGYRLHYGPTSRHYIKTIEVGDATTATLPDLDPGTTYFVAVTAYNSLGVDSPPSSEISVTTLGPTPGLYTGLFSEAAGPQPGQAGSFRLLLKPRGTYSGMVQTGMKRKGFSGKLGEQSLVLASVRDPGANPITLQLQLGSGATADIVTGYVSDGFWIAPAVGYRAPYDAKRRPAPFASAYTLVFPGQADGTAATDGDSYATVRVTPGGIVRVLGMLADGSKFTQAAALANGGLWPVFVPSNEGRGLLAGWLGFESEPDSDLGGTLNWIRPANAKSPYESGGVVMSSRAKGSSYAVPAGSSGAPWSALNFETIFSGGDLVQDFTNDCVRIGASRVRSLNGSGFEMKFARSTGTFQGKVVEPATGEWRRFAGVVLQKFNSGSGFVLVPTHSGRVVLSP